MHIAQFILCSVYFSAQLNKLRPILKFEFWYPIEHIVVPACSSVRKLHFFAFLWFSNSISVISPKKSPCIYPFLPKYAPVSTPSSYWIRYRVIKDTGASYWTKYTLCSGKETTIKARHQVDTLPKNSPKSLLKCKANKPRVNDFVPVPWRGVYLVKTYVLAKCCLQFGGRQKKLDRSQSIGYTVTELWL